MAESESTKSDSSAASTASDGGETTDSKSAGYARGESQKPVTTAYKNNWEAIFGKKKGAKR